MNSISNTVHQCCRAHCANVYVITEIALLPDGSVDVPETLNKISYIGKSKDSLNRASSHFPSPKKLRQLDFDSLDKKTEAIIEALCSTNPVAVINIDCCHEIVSYAVENVLIRCFKSHLTNAYAGHKKTLPDHVLDLLEVAALDFVVAKLSAGDFDLTF